MRKIFSFAAAFAVALVTVSCAHEEFDDFKKDSKSVVFTATIGGDDADTKAELGTNENGKPQTMWTAGDKITVHNGVQGFEFVSDAQEACAAEIPDSAVFWKTGEGLSPDGQPDSGVEEAADPGFESGSGWLWSVWASASDRDRLFSDV